MDRLVGSVTQSAGVLSLEWVEGTRPIQTEKGGVQAVVLGPGARRRDDLAEGLTRRPDDPASIMAPIHRSSSGFSFAIWDPQKNKLSLGSDALGLQSLYYRQTDDGFRFGARMSDVKSYGHKEKLHLAACEHFLSFLSVPPGKTIVGGVRRTFPGVLLSFPNGEPKSNTLYPIESETPSTLDATAKSVGDGLRTCIRETLQTFPSDEPVGLFLSGGIDSTALLALLREAWDGPLMAIHCGPEGNPDRVYAREMAAHFGAKFLDISVDDLDACDSLTWIVSSLENPNGNASAVANCRAFAAAAEWGVRRVFSGLGSDELFCGHTKHLLVPWWPYLARLPQPLRTLAGSLFNRFGHANLARSLGQDGAPSSMHRAMYTFLSKRESDGLRGGLAQFAQPTSLTWDEHADADFPSAYSSEILQIDLNIWLRSSLTPMAGTLAAANEIEIYLPFCSPDMVRLSASMPLAWKVKGRQGKRVLRRAIDDLVPREILQRPRQGFTVPMSDWLRGGLSELAHALLSPSRVENWCLLHPKGLQRMLTEHISGSRDWGLPLWAWMTFSVWHQQFIEDMRRNENLKRFSG